MGFVLVGFCVAAAIIALIVVVNNKREKTIRMQQAENADQNVTADAPARKTSKKQNKLKKWIVGVLAILIIALVANYCYSSWRSNSRKIKDYLRGKEKTTIVKNIVLSYNTSYDIFFYDINGRGFGFNDIAFTLYSHFSDQFTNFDTRQKDTLYIEVWIEFSEWGKIGDEETRAHIEIRSTESGSEIAHITLDAKKSSERSLKWTTVPIFTYLGLARSYMNQERLEASGRIWAEDLINKTNAYCDGHELPRVYN